MVLVTGGTGYIGSHVAVELLNAGYQVLIIDDLSNSSPLVLDRIERICGKRPGFIKCNVADTDPLRKVFSDHPIDSVIHLAGLKSAPESVSEPVKYYSNNLNATLCLLKAMSEYGCRKLVFSSSATVYGVSGAPPFSEDSPTSCTNPYGWSKLMSEQIITDACTADPSLKAVLLRYFNPVGSHESGLIGEDPAGVPLNLFPYICQVAVGRLEKLHVNGNDYPTEDGTGVRDYIHVTDLAAGHLKALNYLSDHDGVRVFNLGTGKGCSVLQMISAFEQATGITIPYEISPRRPGDVPSCWADVTRAERELGWKASRDINDMCRDGWNWQSKNPMGYRQ